MSYEELRDGRQVARKEHRCESCGCRIDKGSPYSQRVYKWGGDLHDEKLHTWCRDELDLFLDDGRGDDGFEFFEVSDFVYEMLCSYGHDPEQEADHE